MKINLSHSWDVSPQEAIGIQRKLQEEVVKESTLGRVGLVAGVDVGFVGNRAKAGVVVLSYPRLAVVEEVAATAPITFPYIPGLLSFREGPAVSAALEKISLEPDLFIFDAQGLAHPRRLGLATHIGIIIARPSIGVAKSRLCGTHKPLGSKVGSAVDLTDNGEIIGKVLRSCKGRRPLYVSIGHRVDLASALRYVLSCCRNHRLPEPTRLAHRLVSGKPLGVRI